LLDKKKQKKIKKVLEGIKMCISLQSQNDEELGFIEMDILEVL
jgi:hypothetical protein